MISQEIRYGLAAISVLPLKKDWKNGKARRSGYERLQCKPSLFSGCRISFWPFSNCMTMKLKSSWAIRALEASRATSVPRSPIAILCELNGEQVRHWRRPLSLQWSRRSFKGIDDLKLLLRYDAGENIISLISKAIPLRWERKFLDLLIILSGLSKPIALAIFEAVEDNAPVIITTWCQRIAFSLRIEELFLSRISPIIRWIQIQIMLNIRKVFPLLNQICNTKNSQALLSHDFYLSFKELILSFPRWQIDENPLRRAFGPDNIFLLPSGENSIHEKELKSFERGYFLHSFQSDVKMFGFIIAFVFPPQRFKAFSIGSKGWLFAG